jgi:hypothetical protein
MSYNITVTNHSPITIATGASDTSTALTLIGKNVPNYGQLIAQNLVNLMQNFASTNQPNGVLSGQLWFDTNTNLLKLYNGTGYKILAAISNQVSAPLSPGIGDLWWDTVNGQLKLFDSVNWIAIGPQTVSSPLIADTITDNISVNHNVARIAVNGVNVAVLSSDTFTARTSYAGLTNITAGLTLTTGVLTGTATQARYADLAEYYTSDKEYEAGTVVMIGGAAEVTAADIVGTTKVVGVVSSNPAYLMNADCEGTRVAVALTGRVPCKVMGSIERGDMLIASDISGVAISSVNSAAGSIIGKALNPYNSDDIGIIEIIVGKH